jgi:GNAT superfamily N-acetyltransferase
VNELIERQIYGTGTNRYIQQEEALVAGANVVMLAEHEVAYIEDVFTVKQHQRKGLARALMFHALRLAQKQGLRYCTLVAFKQAGPFYLNLGFTNIADLIFLKQRKK